MTVSVTDDRDSDLAVRLRLAVGRISRRLRSADRHGLTPSQMSVLATVDRHGPLRMGTLAEIEAISPQTLSRLVARLVDTGLLARTPDPRDARCANVAVSGTGRTLLDGVRRERAASLSAGLATLDPDARARLLDVLPLLETLADRLRDQSGAAR